MALTIGLSQRLSMEQAQKLNLAQVLELSKHLSLPPVVVDKVLDSLTNNIEKSEEILRDSKKELKKSGVGNVFAGFYDSMETGKTPNEGQLITTLNLGSLGGIIEPGEILLEPDVLYVQNKNIKDKPQMFFSETLFEKPDYRMEHISNKYKETKNLAKRLVALRNWSNKKMMESYPYLTSRQREFINTLYAPTKNIASLENLSKELNLHPSTVSRLLSPRYVSIENQSRDERIIIPSKELLCSERDLKKYENIKRLNNYLVEEFEDKEALSDEQIAKEVGYARRTVAKYRINGDIPSYAERDRRYKNGKQEPFQVAYD